MRAVLIYNPAAGRRGHKRLLPRLMETLERSGLALEAVATAAPGDATRIAREAANAGDRDGVLVLGGDGTVREAAVGLLDTGVPLGILPGGTANVLAQALGFPTDPLHAATLLHDSSVRSFDVGLCGETPFLMMASSGLDAVVMGSVDPGLKATFGPAGVFLSGLKSWWTYDYPELTLEVDGETVRATFAAACNIPLYGGPFRLAPEARFDDGLLDVALFRGGRGDTVGFAVDVLRGSHLDRPDVEVRRVEEVVFHGPEGTCLQVDGDACGESLPARTRVGDRKLQVYVR